MRIKYLVPTLVLPFLLSGCMGSIMRHHGDAMGNMDHSRMNGTGQHTMPMSGTMQHTMPMSGTMQHTMPMSGTMQHTMPMHQNMGGMQGVMGMMDEMMAHMQGMANGSTPADAAAMTAMMEQMHGAMQGAMQGAMAEGTMPHDPEQMAAMMGKMGNMMAMMAQMHAGMAGDAEHQAQMAQHMAQMQAMMQSMAGMGHGGMHGAMPVDPAQPFDAQFIDSMIVHHQGAVDMANALLENTERPELLAFAEAILSAQSSEIADMEEWRGAWYPDLAPTAGMDMAMGDMVVSADESKPYEQRFLEAMISHHQGAIDMAQMALTMADHAEIKTLAEAIITSQTAEIEQMQMWLQEWFGVTASTTSPYVAQLASPVRGLSAQEVDDLRAGRGMGFARMAELNSYPGPAHVLELQAALALSDDQIAQVQAIFDKMSGEAKALGTEIVAAEEALSSAFAEGTITEESLAEMTAEIAALYGQLRHVHLRAHLQVTPLLTAEQITQYDALRGYTTDGGHQHHAGMDHGN